MVRVKRGNKTATEYAPKWFHDVFFGKQPNIKVVFRDINDQGSLWNSEDSRTRGESSTLSYPTDHQKSFMVDYGFENAHGYVMGHNSLTAYWDTVQMLHDTDLREYNYEKGYRNGPFHDFSLRVEGPCLIDLNHNFCESWDDNCNRYVSSKGDKITQAREKLSSAMKAPKGSAGGQIVRTRPDKQVNGRKEKEIRRAYMQIAANPHRYILIVNQYFQYARWVREIKRHFSAAKQQGGEAADLHFRLYSRT
ncbi:MULTISPECIES: phosphatidylserine/phosphatidylglycerophosphate/cardiolipin synthase family protein [unclassified Neisseria]|uniref:phospholipase D-like domain-containing protein n=1 Tax=unclassified Neisseria TaxID=2623750 RepID=UPI00266661A1|nr:MULTISPECIES: hypothetical protein [unclassified Neisseria]MDO1510107.1 hypothetical protein [Neisseria sp. MVDL19-042950]MDO1516683.1 hypothetical protein [Neisseria sp. MVDL18-041461]MDO1563830.1 hypothetical protein [Neisseria sp. MVDL20-010259]